MDTPPTTSAIGVGAHRDATVKKGTFATLQRSAAGGGGVDGRRRVAPKPCGEWHDATAWFIVFFIVFALALPSLDAAMKRRTTPISAGTGAGTGGGAGAAAVPTLGTAAASASGAGGGGGGGGGGGAYTEDGPHERAVPVVEEAASNTQVVLDNDKCSLATRDKKRVQENYAPMGWRDFDCVSDQFNDMYEDVPSEFYGWMNDKCFAVWGVDKFYPYWTVGYGRDWCAHMMAYHVRPLAVIRAWHQDTQSCGGHEECNTMSKAMKEFMEHMHTKWAPHLVCVM